MKTTIKDCKPTIVNNDTLMAGDGTFILGKEQATKYCIEKRCCDNLQICLSIKEKLDRKRVGEAEDMLFELLEDNGNK